MNKQESNREGNQNQLFLAVMVFLGIAIIYQIGLTAIAWGKKHPYQATAISSLIICLLAYWIYTSVPSFIKKNIEEAQVTNGKGEDSVFAGFSGRKKIFINQSFRRMHTQVVGTTNAGKTESVILPWIIDDIEKGRGLVLIDGKSDRALLDKIYAYACKHGRESDFHVLSLSDHSISGTYNPLIGSSVDQITEKIMHSFDMQNEYYKNIQFDTLRNILEVFREAKEVPNFMKLREVLLDSGALQRLSEKVQSPILRKAVLDFLNNSKDKRKELASGLVTQLGFFTSSEMAPLFNTSNPTISVSKAMQENKILYFQLPVLRNPILGKAVAKMVLQDIQGAVSERHTSLQSEHTFFSVYLDDFTEYLTPQFVSLLNKSRSANVGVVFAHQAIGDLEVLGAEVKNQILTNSNLKVFMRTNEPDSAEYFSKIIGTKQSSKVTRRQKAELFGAKVTNDGSIREVEEFIFHPNIFKSELGLGQAVLVLPHKNGSKALKIKFVPRPNLPRKDLPFVSKPNPEYLQEPTPPNSPSGGAVSLAALAAEGV